MKLYLPMIAMAGVALLSACNKNDEPEVVGGPADPMAEQLANAAPVELPPSVKATKQYRCKDNSLYFVDFMTDDKTANFDDGSGCACFSGYEFDPKTTTHVSLQATTDHCLV